MNKMSSIFNIEKLDNSNFDTWSIQMENVLVYQELWSIASGEYLKPESNEDNAVDIAAWTVKDQKAKSMIVLSIMPTQILHIRNCGTSNEAWKALNAVHKPKGPGRKVSLFKNLFNMRMVETDCIQQYVYKFCLAVEKLIEAEIELQEESLVIMLLASLPKSYENLVVALESRDDLPSLNALKIKLIEEGRRRKEENTNTNSKNSELSEQAFMVRNKKKYFDNKNGENSYKNNNGKNFKCYNCGVKGHYAAQCKDARKPSINYKNQNYNNRQSLFTIMKNGLFTMSNNDTFKETWCVDSGATSHLCCNKNMFDEFEEYEEIIMLAGDNKMKTEGKGTVHLKINNFDVILKDVLFVPGIQCNFISVAKALNNGYSVFFNKKSAVIKNNIGEIILRANKISDLFIIQPSKNNLFFMRKNFDKAMQWHKRFGHLNFASLRELVNKNMVRGINVELPLDISCSVCMKGKCTQKPFENSTTRATELLQVVHTDVCGPINKGSIGGAKYILTFIDDKSRYMFVYFLKRKDQVFETFKEFKMMVERQTDKKLKILRSDNGTEFVNNLFNDYLKKHGIQRQLTVPYTPQQNGVAERFNRTLVEMARCMIIESGVDESLWAEAVHTAAYLRNRAPTKALDGTTPYQIWYGYKPSVGHLKIFGSKAVALDKKQHSKFKSKGKEYVMVGYSNVSKAYRLYNAETKQLIISRDVYFIEPNEVKQQSDCELLKKNVVKSRSTDYTTESYEVPTIVELSEIIETSEETEIPVIEEVPVNEETPVSEESAENRDESARNINIEQLEEIGMELMRRGPGRPKILRTGAPGRPRKQFHVINFMKVIDIKVPKFFKEVEMSNEKEQWKIAMQKEYESLIKNNTWVLEKLPADHKAIGSKWVFAVKSNPDGTINKFKARLVAKGCSQKYGIDYNETFSPVVRHSTVRFLIALAVEKNLHLHQMDVVTAYLNGDLNEVIYMNQPQGFLNDSFPNHVLKLKKSLYGLKQAGRQWNIKLEEKMKKLGYMPTINDPCLYKGNSKKLKLIAVYVDDLILAFECFEDLMDFKRKISEEIDIVDKGELNYFLGLEIERNKNKNTEFISIGQQKYINELLTNYGMNNCRSASTPLDIGFQAGCQKPECKRANIHDYQKLIGELLYISIKTRPDIAHAVSKLAQYCKEPHIEHEAAAKHILRFLSTTINLKIKYTKTGKNIEGFVDADWANDINDRKSFTGIAFIFAGAIFSWESHKQKTTALSSTEAEYVALSTAVKEAMYLKNLLSDLNMNSEQAIKLYGDNLSAQHLARNAVYHSRTKHIDVKVHHIREVIRKGIVEISYVSTDEMMADILTKNLSKVKHMKFTNMMGLNN